MINLQDLSEFLVEAKKSTYAAGDSANKITNPDSSTTITFEKGPYKYHDNYFGGEPYGGREVVFYKDKPTYIMTYYGYVDPEVKDIGKLYAILMNALKLIPIEHPFRGPNEYIEDDFIYQNTFKGKVDRFSGSETIKQKYNLIYQASYMGGLVDIR